MMKEGTLELFSTEIKHSYRGFKERVVERPFMTFWFIILLVGGFWMVLMMVELIQGIDELPFTPSQGNILFVVFFVIMSKASVETVENTMRNHQLKHYFSTPISFQKVQISRFLKVFWYNLLLIALSLSIVCIHIYSFGFQPPIDDYFFYNLYILGISAPIIGFNLGVMTQVKKNIVKMGLLILYGQNITLVWLVLHSNISSTVIPYYLLAISLLSFVVLLTSKKLFWMGWKNGTSSSSSQNLRFHGSGDILPGFLDTLTRRVAEKEILIRWRRRESPASLGVTALIGGGLLFTYIQLGPDPDLGLGLDEFFYPVLIGMGLFLAVTLQVLFPTLSLFGREGKAFWLIRSLPVKPKNVIRGKVLAILLFSPFIPLMVALPVPILLSYSFEKILFLFISSLLLIILLGGIGAWASSKYPNFDESVNGAPDVTTMYTTMMVGMFFSGIFVLIPASIFILNRWYGLLALTSMLAITTVIFYILCGRAATLYHEREMDF